MQPISSIGEYSFAMNRRTVSYTNDINQILHIYISSLMLNASCSRNQQILLCIYTTSIDYLDENIFQPFLATHSSKLLDIQDSNTSQICDYRSAWIKEEFYTNMNCNKNRVYGAACFSL
ncbi:unnamed protein product [Adineta steineri]|uniref:Uncharacterized protein n=2 Tax=Adineta steineri TaxID=433720 RepID=A0A813MQS8_9BILA|nr:unnamed protein product [Adineta steineri]